MKKSLMAILAVFCAMALQASEDSFLYWMIDPNATIVGNWGVETPVSAGTYYARVGYTTTERTDAQVISAGQLDGYLNLYASVDEDLVNIQDNSGIKDGGNIITSGDTGVQAMPVYAGMPTVNAANYTYWIELLNEDNTIAGYGSIGMYETLAEYVSSMQGPGAPSLMIPVRAFAAPEPNSALLMLIGCAALALRRRKQIAA